MGGNNGTGQPNNFRCSACRKELWGDPDHGWASCVRLTGRKRPHRGKAGARNSYIDREYTCLDCGHTGWSCHIELAYKAGDHRELMIKDGVEVLPSWASGQS